MVELVENLRAYPNALQAIGVFGFMLYVGAFSAIQAGRLCGNSIIFSINQVVAASCVLIGLAGAFNLASFLIQVSYISIGLYGISVRWRRARRANLSRHSQPPCEPGTISAPLV
ncbi:CBU_0592 family membrane protein [Celeribacter arenosi]|uniref:CBU_0592 family membrane protein n=1 Tax=Celeribacter arenosi TaxID=792649 RepID=UPI0031D45CAD